MMKTRLSLLAAGLAVAVLLAGCHVFPNDFPVAVGNRTASTVTVFANGEQIGEVGSNQTATFTLDLSPTGKTTSDAIGNSISPTAIAQATFSAQDMLAAIARGEFEAILPYLHPNVVFTPMNGEVSRGPQAIRAYFDKMLKGPDAIVKSIRLGVEVDRLADFYGDTALAFGSSNDQYALSNGMDFHIQTRWTASLVRENGRWLITAFHSSANAFDNPILEKARQVAMLQWGGIGTAAGALIGLLVGRAVGRRGRA